MSRGPLSEEHASTKHVALALGVQENELAIGRLLSLHAFLLEARAPYTVVGGWHPLFFPTSFPIPSYCPSYSNTGIE